MKIMKGGKELTSESLNANIMLTERQRAEREALTVLAEQARVVEFNAIMNTANTTQEGLDSSIEEAITKKEEVDSSTALASQSKVNLDGSIALSGTTKTELVDKIAEAVSKKAEIEQVILDNEVVTKPEFNLHKLDYASQMDYLTTQISGSWQLIRNITLAESINVIEITTDTNEVSIDKKYKEFLIIGTIKRDVFTTAKNFSINTLGVTGGLTVNEITHIHLKMWIEESYHKFQVAVNRVLSNSTIYNVVNGMAWRPYDVTSGQYINYLDANPTFKKINIVLDEAIAIGSNFKVYGR